MSEAIEYRIANLKTFVGYGIALMILIIALGFYIAKLLLIAVLFEVFAAVTLIVVYGRTKRGYCRTFAAYILPFEYKDPPTDEWREELEARGAFK